MNQEWTGERLETFIFNENTIEHLHRYGIVMSLVDKKTVLDIACGEGYGSNLLASKALNVVGVDIDLSAVENAKKKYQASNLTFVHGSADNIPLKDSSFDIVVSFETIEHLTTQDEMMNEIKRVLKPDGVLIISTLEKSGEVSPNHFHLKELTREEFTTLIEAHFKFSKLYLQKIVHGSLIAPAVNNGSGPIEYLEGDYQKMNPCDEILNHVYNEYYIYVASNKSLISMPYSFFDGSQVLLQHMLRPYKNSRLYKLSATFKNIFLKNKK